jgi:hypothetical protein
MNISEDGVISGSFLTINLVPVQALPHIDVGGEFNNCA